MVRGANLSSDAATKLMDLLGFPRIDTLTESLRYQIPGAKVIERQPGAPIRLKVEPAEAALQDQPSNSMSADTGTILHIVEVALAIAITGADHLNKQPRPADYVAAFRPITRDAVNLLKVLGTWTEFFRDQFAMRGHDLVAIEKALASLKSVSKAVVKHYGKEPSKGAPKNTALCVCIKLLRETFQSNYFGPRTGRKERGAFHFPGTEELRELEFVETALWEARVIRPNREKLRSVIRRHFRDPRCTPSQR